MIILIARILDIIFAGACLVHLIQTHPELAEMCIILMVASRGLQEVKVTNYGTH